eukprot:7382165-Prymnesium_polylepis.1
MRRFRPVTGLTTGAANVCVFLTVETPARPAPTVAAAPPRAVGGQAERQLLALRQYIEVKRQSAGNIAPKPWKLSVRRTQLCDDLLAAFGGLSHARRGAAGCSSRTRW